MLGTFLDLLDRASHGTVGTCIQLQNKKNKKRKGTFLGRNKTEVLQLMKGCDSDDAVRSAIHSVS